MGVEYFLVLKIHLHFSSLFAKTRCVPLVFTRCFKTGILTLSPGSTSKAGGVRFPDDDEPPGSPTRRDDQSNLSTLFAVLEKDGSYLVKVCVPVDAYKQVAPVQVSTLFPTMSFFSGWFSEEPSLLWDCLHSPRCPHTWKRVLLPSFVLSNPKVHQPQDPSYQLHNGW